MRKKHKNTKTPQHTCAGAGWTSAGLGTRQGEAAVTAVDAVSYVCTVLHQHGDSVI